MSDNVVKDPAIGGAPAGVSALFLDGDAPRLGAAPTIAPPPSERLEAMAPTMPSLPADAPTLPVVSPVLASSAAPLLPAPSTATEQTVSPGQDQASPSGPPTDTEPEHPMAHLMPSKAMPTEASRRAAEIRAAQKAKSKKIKIGVIAGMLLFTAVVGPPLGKWLVDAVNESGETGSVEEPAE